MEQQYSTRQNKISKLIQKELSEYFRKEAKTVFGGRMISVTTVRVAKDLSLAKCYLSIFPSENMAEYVKEVNTIKTQIRYALGLIVKRQLRVVPDLEFFVDDSLDYINNIDKILNDLKK